MFKISLEIFIGVFFKGENIKKKFFKEKVEK